MPTIIYIYTLRCPISGLIRYVGATTQPEQRQKSHCRNYPSASYSVIGWLSELRKEGIKPIFEIIDETTDGQMELYWIQQLAAWGYPLLNKRGVPGNDSLGCAPFDIAPVNKEEKRSLLLVSQKLRGKICHCNYIATYEGLFGKQTKKQREKIYQNLQGNRLDGTILENLGVVAKNLPRNNRP